MKNNTYQEKFNKAYKKMTFDSLHIDNANIKAYINGDSSYLENSYIFRYVDVKKCNCK